MDKKIRHIGLISDTHGLLRESAVVALSNSDIIIHAGDIDTPEILGALKKIAPVFPVRGNMDRNPGVTALPKYEIVEQDAFSIFVLHDIAQLDLDPAAAGFAVVISGHTHQPEIKYRDNVLYINPGSAGPRRFTLPISVGMLEIEDGRITPRIIELDK